MQDQSFQVTFSTFSTVKYSAMQVKREDGLDREDLALVDEIFDTLEIDNDGRVDIEKVFNDLTFFELSC